MVLRLKGELMGGDFADNLQRLQSYPRDFDVEELVWAAKQLHATQLARCLVVCDSPRT